MFCAILVTADDDDLGMQNCKNINTTSYKKILAQGESVSTRFLEYCRFHVYAILITVLTAILDSPFA